MTQAKKKTDYQIVPIASLVRDGTQTRTGLTPERVAQYAERARAGDVFPAPVVFFDGAKTWLADGFHRVEAFVRCGFDNVECDVRKGGKADAILFGVAANVEHDRSGLHRSNADKRRAVEMSLAALTEKSARWPDAQIAQHCGVSAPTVADVRRQLELFASGAGAGEGEEPSAEAAQAAGFKSADRFIHDLARKHFAAAPKALAAHLRAWADRLEKESGQ